MAQNEGPHPRGAESWREVARKQTGVETSVSGLDDIHIVTGSVSIYHIACYISAKSVTILTIGPVSMLKSTSFLSPFRLTVFLLSTLSRLQFHSLLYFILDTYSTFSKLFVFLNQQLTF